MACASRWLHWARENRSTPEGAHMRPFWCKLSSPLRHGGAVGVGRLFRVSGLKAQGS